MIGHFFSFVSAQDTYRNPQTDIKLLEKFQYAKLGMFVHWMVCHTPETGDSWSIGNPTPKKKADSISFAWNPKNFNAKKIVSTAKKLGCNYMIVISKHHDGFAIWKTQYSNFNVSRTLFKKDILKELSKECKKQGLLFGIYYSIADIDYAGWAKMAEADGKIPMPKKGKEDFIQFNKNQVKELVTQYDPDILWFDGFWLDPVLWTPKEGIEMYNYVKSLKPNILQTRLSVRKNPDNPKEEIFVNDGSSGDFYGIEAKTETQPNFPWEGCTSVSYPVYAYEPKTALMSAEKLILNFDRTICGNGNFLLNIGPKRTGELPKELINRFNELTKWISLIKTAVYNTKGGPYIQGDWGGSTYNDDKIYIHIRKETKLLILPLLKNYTIQSVTDLKSKKTIPYTSNNKDIEISLPDYKTEDLIPIIEIKLDKKFNFENWISLKK